MPKDEFDHEDPMSLVGVELPATGDEDEAFTRGVIEEYALLGYSPEMILGLFRAPMFQATYRVYESRGEAWVVAMLDKVVEEWRGGAARSEPAKSG